MQFEDYCCFLAGKKLLLPRVWREENVRIRLKLADQEYPRLPEGSLRLARILDDVFPQSLAMIPRLNDIMYEVPSLKKLDYFERTQTAARLEDELKQYLDDIDKLLNSPHVIEVLQPSLSPSSLHQYKHGSCCPRPPFTPHRMEFPPAGIFRMVTYSTVWYIRSVLSPAIRAHLADPTDETTRLQGPNVSYYSHEICRTFAGIEDDLSGVDPDSLIPLYSLLMISTTTSNSETRVWLWYKLRHSERLGFVTFEAMKRHLAILWNIPEIITHGFLSEPPERMHGRDLSCDDIIAATRDMKLEE